MKPPPPLPGRMLALFATLAAVAVYANSVANGFALDDVYIVQMNARVHDPGNLAGIWLTPYWPVQGLELGLYRPLTIFLFAVQWALADGAPWLFHVTNVALHAGVTLLVFLLLQRLTASTAAFAGALLFAVHPVHTEAVANVVGQAELVTAAAILAACLIHAARPDGLAVSWSRRALITLLFLVALTAKENAVVLPGLLVLLDFTQRRVRLSREGIADYARMMAMPLFLMGAALALYLMVRFSVMDGFLTGSNAAPAMPFLREEYRVLNALRAFPELVRLLVFPQDLAADYSPAVLLPVDEVRPMVVLGAALLAVLIGLAALTPWLPGVGFPAAWFLITIITVSNLFFPIGVLVAERTLYLPSVAVSAVVACGWHAAARRTEHRLRVFAAAALALIVILFGWATWSRNPDWRTTNTVWQAMFRDHPESYRSQWVRASLLNVAGQSDLAEQHYRLAHAIYDRDAQFISDFANFLMSRGRYGEALRLLEDTRDRGPLGMSGSGVLAYGYVATGRYREAIDILRHVDPDGGNYATAMALSAYAYRGLGEQDRAIAAWRVAVRRSSRDRSRLWSFLSRSLALGGYPADAAIAADSALATASDSAARATVVRLQAALNRGCFGEASASAVPADGYAAKRPLQCDPLGEWFSFVPPAHSATSLHNATTAPPQRSDPPSS